MAAFQGIAEWAQAAMPSFVQAMSQLGRAMEKFNEAAKANMAEDEEPAVDKDAANAADAAYDELLYQVRKERGEV
jgi:hypothetical protein